MKKLLTILLMLFPFYCFSQDFYYSKKLEYLDNNLISNTKGNYRLEFEIGNLQGQQLPLFTIYHNDVEQTWLAFTENKGSMKKQGSNEILSKDLYFDTKTSQGTLVLSSSNKDKIIIFYNNNKRVEYYKY